MGIMKNWKMDMESATEDAVGSGAKTVEDVLNYVKAEMDNAVDEGFVRRYAQDVLEHAKEYV